MLIIQDFYYINNKSQIEVEYYDTDDKREDCDTTEIDTNEFIDWVKDHPDYEGYYTIALVPMPDDYTEHEIEDGVLHTSTRKVWELDNFEFISNLDKKVIMDYLKEKGVL
jgi:hypothetical protein